MEGTFSVEQRTDRPGNPSDGAGLVRYPAFYCGDGMVLVKGLEGMVQFGTVFLDHPGYEVPASEV